MGEGEGEFELCGQTMKLRLDYKRYSIYLYLNSALYRYKIVVKGQESGKLLFVLAKLRLLFQIQQFAMKIVLAISAVLTLVNSFTLQPRHLPKSLSYPSVKFPKQQVSVVGPHYGKKKKQGGGGGGGYDKRAQKASSSSSSSTAQTDR